MVVVVMMALCRPSETLDCGMEDCCRDLKVMVHHDAGRRGVDVMASGDGGPDGGDVQ